MSLLLALKNVSLRIGGEALLTGAELSLAPGERVALVGRNGSGKSTLLKIAAGLIEPDGGERFIQPGATWRYLAQEPDFSGFASTLAFVEAGLGPGDDPHRARYLVEALGLSGSENPAALSGGEARRAAIARALAPAPDILLLDEPTNHLDLAAIEWLEAELGAGRAAIALVSHDRRLLGKLSRATVWLDRGRTRRVEMGFADFENWRDKALAEEEIERHKLDRRIAAEEDWVRYGVTARRKRNVKRMANLQAMRAERRDARRVAAGAVLNAAEAHSSGRMVIEAEGLSKAYDGRPIVAGFSIRIHRGDRVGLVGPNGAGKTTLLSLLTGRLAPDAGRVRLGANLAIAELEQNRDSLDPEWTLAEAVTRGGGDRIGQGAAARHVTAFLKDFLFAPAQARTPLKALSGGERARVMLARALALPSNLLVLDEPTNDLDIETLDALEEMLAAYEGTVILISHDRDFLDRVVTSVVAPDGEGRWIEYAGGYSDMLAQRGAEAAGKTRAPRAKEAAAMAAPAAPAREKAAKRRLSFNEKHALETLPGVIAELEGKIAAARRRLEDPGLYERDRALFDRTAASLSALEAELAAAEEKWLALELLREELAQ